MKHLNFLSTIGGTAMGLQSSDTGYRCRVVTDSLPSFYRVKMLRFISVLVLILTIGAGQMWGGNNTPAPAGTYNLVTNASSLAAGDVIIIAGTAASGSGYAISTTQNNNNRGQASVTITDNTITIPANNSTVQGITLEAGTTNGTLSFKVGDNGYLYAASSSQNYLKTESTKSANSSWTISISSNNATVTAQGSNTRKLMRHNSGSSIFACYATNTSTGTAVRIFKKAAASCTNPSTLLSISSSNTATLGTDKTLTTSGGNNGTVTWTVANGTGSATVSGNTLHPISAGTVTVTATQDDNNGKCGKVVNQTITISKAEATITLSELGASSSVSGTHYGGDSYTLPTSTEAACTGKKLVGWSTVKIEETDDKPTSNFYAKGEIVTLAAGSNTFYAVFAEGDGGTLTVTRSDVSTSGTGYAECTWTVGTINGKVNLYKNTTSYIQIGGSNLPHPYSSTQLPAAISRITITMPASGTCRTWTPRVSASAAQSSTSSTGGTNLTAKTFSAVGTSLVWDVDTDEDYRYFYLSSGGNTNIASFEIEYGIYTKYATSCCQDLGSINGSVT